MSDRVVADTAGQLAASVSNAHDAVFKENVERRAIEEL
jgi:hypothetical protein